MKTSKLEKWVLLEQSGELSARRQRILDACPEAQKKRDEFNLLFNSISAVDCDPSPWTVAKIDAQLQVRPRSLGIDFRVWKHVLTMAACMALVVSTWTLRQSSVSSQGVSVTSADAWSDDFEADLFELEDVIFAMSGDPLEILEL